MNCPKCGRQNKKRSKFCSDCGEVLKEIKQVLGLDCSLER
ncbi:zinc-ribbon domain-containing protein [Acetoanaerobium sticklandii]